MNHTLFVLVFLFVVCLFKITWLIFLPMGSFYTNVLTVPFYGYFSCIKIKYGFYNHCKNAMFFKYPVLAQVQVVLVPPTKYSMGDGR
jgi:hypothetical protein